MSVNFDLCKCGHERVDHVNTWHTNYCSGGKCNCEHFELDMEKNYVINQFETFGRINVETDQLGWALGWISRQLHNSFFKLERSGLDDWTIIREK